MHSSRNECRQKKGVLLLQVYESILLVKSVYYSYAEIQTHDERASIKGGGISLQYEKVFQLLSYYDIGMDCKWFYSWRTSRKVLTVNRS